MNDLKMKNPVFLWLWVVLSLVLLNCNSNNSNKEVRNTEESQVDEYAPLREESQAPQRMAEDLSGNVIILTEKDFIERITEIDNPKGFQYLGQTPCIVSLYANWCKPCGILSEIMNLMAPEYKGKVIFYKLDIDRAIGVSNAFKVTSIPKILYFKPRSSVSTTVGFLNKEELANMIEQFLLNP